MKAYALSVLNAVAASVAAGLYLNYGMPALYAHGSSAAFDLMIALSFAMLAWCVIAVIKVMRFFK
jgi:hypothetical protein